MGFCASEDRRVTFFEQIDGRVKVRVDLCEDCLKVLTLLADEILAGRLGVDRHARVGPTELVLQRAVRRTGEPVRQIEI